MNKGNNMSRAVFFSSSAASAFLTFTQISNAEDIVEDGVEPVAATTTSIEKSPLPSAPVSESGSVESITRTIQGCPKPQPGKPNNCVATSNIKQLDTYSPPWTFDVTPDEAFARLKGIVKSEPSYTIIDTDEGARYLKVDIARGFNAIDTMEFSVKADDKVVVFKSYEKENSGISDFGANRKRVEELRNKSGGVFAMMGGGMTADSYDGGAQGKRNGLGGQLKAFYGLNSGVGYQDVFN